MYAQVFNYIFKAASSISYEEDMKQYQSGLVWFIYSSSLLLISYLSLHLLSGPPPPSPMDVLISKGCFVVIKLNPMGPRWGFGLKLTSWFLQKGVCSMTYVLLNIYWMTELLSPVKGRGINNESRVFFLFSAVSTVYTQLQHMITAKL